MKKSQYKEGLIRIEVNPKPDHSHSIDFPKNKITGSGLLIETMEGVKVLTCTHCLIDPAHQERIDEDDFNHNWIVEFHLFGDNSNRIIAKLEKYINSFEGDIALLTFDTGGLPANARTIKLSPSTKYLGGEARFPDLFGNPKILNIDYNYLRRNAPISSIFAKADSNIEKGESGSPILHRQQEDFCFGIISRRSTSYKEKGVVVPSEFIWQSFPETNLPFFGRNKEKKTKVLVIYNIQSKSGKGFCEEFFKYVNRKKRFAGGSYSLEIKGINDFLNTDSLDVDLTSEYVEFNFYNAWKDADKVLFLLTSDMFDSEGNNPLMDVILPYFANFPPNQLICINYDLRQEEFSSELKPFGESFAIFKVPKDVSDLKLIGDVEYNDLRFFIENGKENVIPEILIKILKTSSIKEIINKEILDKFDFNSPIRKINYTIENRRNVKCFPILFESSDSWYEDLFLYRLETKLIGQNTNQNKSNKSIKTINIGKIDIQSIDDLLLDFNKQFGEQNLFDTFSKIFQEGYSRNHFYVIKNNNYSIPTETRRHLLKIISEFINKIKDGLEHYFELVEGKDEHLLVLEIQNLIDLYKSLWRQYSSIKDSNTDLLKEELVEYNSASNRTLDSIEVLLSKERSLSNKIQSGFSNLKHIISQEIDFFEKLNNSNHVDALDFENQQDDLNFFLDEKVGFLNDIYNHLKNEPGIKISAKLFIVILIREEEPASRNNDYDGIEMDTGLIKSIQVRLNETDQYVVQDINKWKEQLEQEIKKHVKDGKFSVPTYNVNSNSFKSYMKEIEDSFKISFSHYYKYLSK